MSVYAKPPTHAHALALSVPARPWAPPDRTAKRMALWEFSGGLQCSVIGTCLSEDDLVAAIRRSNLALEPMACSHDIHAYCVKTAATDCPLARTLNKLLDRRFAGAIRLAQRAQGAEELEALWVRLRDTGQIGAGYWALLSHTHVEVELRKRIFGEVHMLSHLNGRGARDMAVRVAELERRHTEMEARLKRAEAARQEAQAERDAARHALDARAAPPPATGPTQASGAGESRALSRSRTLLAKRDRALMAARARARHVEAENASLRRALEDAGRARRLARQRLPAEVRGEQPRRYRLDGRRILYLGGRRSVLPHLKSAAEAREASVLFHDGGIEDSPHRIEELIGTCHAVVCPIDCVSHGACKLAKSLCRRFNKPFLPIHSASRSGFERALELLAGPMAAEPAPPATAPTSTAAGKP